MLTKHKKLLCRVASELNEDAMQVQSLKGKFFCHTGVIYGLQTSGHSPTFGAAFLLLPSRQERGNSAAYVMMSSPRKKTASDITVAVTPVMH